MPDLGRWNGMDQLSESYHSASPYTYVFNNPVSLVDVDVDVDGRWFDEGGNTDTSGRATTGIGARSRYTQFLGTTDNQFAWGYIPFGDTAAYSDLMSAEKSKGATGGLSNIGGTLRWWTDTPNTSDEFGNFVFGVGHFNMLKLKGPEIRQSYHNFNPYKTDNTLEWYSFGGRANVGLGSMGVGLANFSGKLELLLQGHL